MKQQITNENYREIYKNYFNINFNDNYDIHHIDFDHSNNNIDNLILLPKELHNKYHNLINMLGLKNTINFNINLMDGQDFHYRATKELCEIMEEITFWKMIRIKKYARVKLL